MKRYKKSIYSEAKEKAGTFKNLDAIIAAEGGHHSIDVARTITHQHITIRSTSRSHTTRESVHHTMSTRRAWAMLFFQRCIICGS